MKTFSQQITGGSYIELPSGKVCTLINTTAAVDVEFFDHGNKSIAILEGLRAFKIRMKGGERFSKVRVSSATTQTVKVGLGEDEAFDIDIIEGDINANIVTPTGFEGITDVTLTAATPTLIAPANADRKKLFVNSINANFNNMRIGGSDVSATKGRQLLPDGTIEIESSAAVYAFSSGTPIVSISEEKI